MKPDEKTIYLKIKAGYDKAAIDFSNTRQYFWSDKFPFIKDYLKENDKILDFGCGNGRLIDFLTIKKSNYLGVDVSKKLIELARQKNPGYKFKVISWDFKQALKDSAFKANSFDVILSIAVFHHFPAGEQRIKILKKLKKLLKPGGVLIVTVWNLNQRKYLEILNGQKEGYIPFKNSQAKVIFNRYCYRFEKPELERFFNNAGLKVVDSGYSMDKEAKNIYCVGRK